MGIDLPLPMHPDLFDFQQLTVSYCLRIGTGALFLDTGLGKTFIELELAKQCIAHTNRPALILTPLAVAQQTKAEADRFGYAAKIIRTQSEAGPATNICNYEMMHQLDFSAYSCLILDESSILKNFGGKTAQSLVQAGAAVPFRFCASATPAPNDHIELGMHSEFLGRMSIGEMRARWFVNDKGNTSTWRLKGHAVASFWDWVASWAVLAEKPSDLGFPSSRFELPPLRVEEHVVNHIVDARSGVGFFSPLSATNLHGVKRSTVEGRAALVKEIVQQEPNEAWVIWCDTDYEADALHRALPGVVEVRGSMSPHDKEKALLAFAAGSRKQIITKPSIAGFGLNWQHCARVVFVGRSFSYETWYQAVRRCWRFGQKREVVVHLIFADGERHIDAIIGEKAERHASMKLEMRAAASRAIRDIPLVDEVILANKTQGNLPAWL